VLQSCLAVGSAIDGTGSLFSRMMDGTGAPLPVPPPPPRLQTRLPASISLLRTELARILQGAAMASGAELILGQTIDGLQQQEEQVEVEFSDGSQAAFDLLIGADGPRSLTRRLLYGDAIQPQYTGTMSLRWVLQPGVAGPAGFYCAPDGRMIVVSQLPGPVTYVAAGLEMPNRRVGAAEARELLRRLFDGFTAPLLLALRAAIDEQQEVIARPFEWLLLGNPWHRGQVCLIGDAAHSTSAHLSAGGSMAMEDAVVLAQELQQAAVPVALERFMARRFERTRFVVDSSLQLARLQQANADPKLSAQLRAQAVTLLSQPY